MGWRLLGMEEMAAERAEQAASKAAAAVVRDTPRQIAVEAEAAGAQAASLGAIRKIDGAIAARAAAEAAQAGGPLAAIAAADAEAARIAAKRNQAVSDLDAANSVLRTTVGVFSGLGSDVVAANVALMQALADWIEAGAGSSAEKALEAAVRAMLKASTFLVAEVSGLPDEAGDKSAVHAKRVAVAAMRAESAVLDYTAARNAVPVAQDQASQLFAQRAAEFLEAMAGAVTAIEVHLEAAETANAAYRTLLETSGELSGAEGVSGSLSEGIDVAAYMAAITDDSVRKKTAARLALARAEALALLQKAREKAAGG